MFCVGPGEAGLDYKRSKYQYQTQIFKLKTLQEQCVHSEYIKCLNKKQTKKSPHTSAYFSYQMIFFKWIYRRHWCTDISNGVNYILVKFAYVQLFLHCTYGTLSCKYTDYKDEA